VSLALTNSPRFATACYNKETHLDYPGALQGDEALPFAQAHLRVHQKVVKRIAKIRWVVSGRSSPQGPVGASHDLNRGR
jgi:hypothetical protein